MPLFTTRHQQVKGSLEFPSTRSSGLLRDVIFVTMMGICIIINMDSPIYQLKIKFLNSSPGEGFLWIHGLESRV